MAITFEFDPEKSAGNLAKHGIDFVEAQSLWADPHEIVAPSAYELETRWMAIGSIGDKLWSAIFTYREARIRIILVRRSRPTEVLGYEQQAANR